MLKKIILLCTYSVPCYTFKKKKIGPLWKKSLWYFIYIISNAKEKLGQCRFKDYCQKEWYDNRSIEFFYVSKKNQMWGDLPLKNCHHMKDTFEDEGEMFVHKKR